MVGDIGEDIYELGLGIDVVEFAGDDQGTYQGGALTASIGGGEEPRLAAEGDPPRRCW
jgi:hypothetical protein